MKRKPSIIQDGKKCFICGRTAKLDCHHCIHGTANRKIADREGLWVWLCQTCHKEVHDKDREKDLKCIKAAQRAYEENHNRDEWMALFSHNWLWDEE